MKKVVLTLVILGSALVAADFSQMSTAELTALRGTVPLADRDAFRSEMQSRLSTMSSDERATFLQNRPNRLAVNGKKNVNLSREGTRSRQRLRDGSGFGAMKQRKNSKNQSKIDQKPKGTSGKGNR